MDSWVSAMILHRKVLTKGSCVSEKVLKWESWASTEVSKKEI